MKPILLLLFVSSMACGQQPGPARPGLAKPKLEKPGGQSIRRDSTLPRSGPAPMPINRPENDFYRHPNDPDNVVRASLDNMPVKVPDTTVEYTILSDGRYIAPRQNSLVRPNLKLTPLPKLPKKNKP